MRTKRIAYLFFIFTLFSFQNLYAQTTGFLHASGTRILDNQGNNLILRGIGTGNWMLQEGYMMGTNGATNGTQWHFKQKLTETIGTAKTKEFYDAWLDNHFTKVDVDSMAAWGFNSVRPALHYKVFTLPIEEEPVPGQDTWLEAGFQRLDDLVEWCAENQMYVIFDMHGCPGAQGSDSNISDYDSSKPSLWESEENKRKLVALWRKIAERYADHPWVGGYDLINEPKWDALRNNNNRDLWDLFKRMIDAIREVDNNHLIFLAGNNWGNDYAGLPNISSWGGNIALSFHKYWNYNDEGSLNWIINLGNQHNVPVWLGETGENSNTWFTDLIRLCESKNIGWSWWPVKKMGINNILRSKSNSNYDQLLNAWRRNQSINATTAYNGVMKFAEDHKLENCNIQYDVIDAMITRPHTYEPRPFKKHQIEEPIFAVDYDLGPVGYAYFDVDDADYHGSEGGNFVNFNRGGQYRNDGVDIETCNDITNNGYSVGWIEDGEWLLYTINTSATKSYTVQFRYATQTGGGRVYVEVNGSRASQTVNLPATGDWKNWSTTVIPNLIVPAGSSTIKIIFETGGVNFNYFKLTNPKDVAAVNFELLEVETDVLYDRLILSFNRPVDEVSINSFEVKVNQQEVAIKEVITDTDHRQLLILKLNQEILTDDVITISTLSNDCKSGSTVLKAFANNQVSNKMATHFTLPAKVEAEDYAVNNGFEFEDTEDVGGGQNAGYAATGKYLDYIIYTEKAVSCNIDLRVAVNKASARIAMYDIGETNQLINAVTLSNTGGWQKWQTQQSTAHFKRGKNIFRIQAITDGFNLNWFEFSNLQETGVASSRLSNHPVKVYPNPVKDYLYIVLNQPADVCLSLNDLTGRVQYANNYSNLEKIKIDVSSFYNGIYVLQLNLSDHSFSEKIIVDRT